MTVWAVSMMRDEVDVAVRTLAHLVDEGVDGIVVADNRSTDGTFEALAEFAATAPIPVIVQRDEDPAYYQSAKMTALATLAGTEHGADWIVPFDADELWLAPDRLGPWLAGLPGHVDVVPARLYNHFATALDLAGPNPFETMIYRQAEPAPLPKVAFRWKPASVVHQGNHGVDGTTSSVDADVTIRHFPYRTFEQFARKARNGAAAYAATDLPTSAGAHWRQYGEILERHGEQALRDVWERWYWFLSPVDGGLVHDPAPWHRWT